MRIFWILLVVVAAIGAFVVFGGSGSSTPGPTVAESAGEIAAVPGSVPSSGPAVETASVPTVAAADGLGADASAGQPGGQRVVEPAVEPIAERAIEPAETAVADAVVEENDTTPAGTEEVAAFGGLVFTPEPVVTDAEADGSTTAATGSDGSDDPDALKEAGAALAGLLGLIGDGAEAIVTGVGEGVEAGVGVGVGLAGGAADAVDAVLPGGDADVAEADAGSEQEEADLDAVLAELIAGRPANADDVPADPATPVTTDVALDAVREHPDGGLEIGGRWRVPGSGTAEDPYVLRWEVLQSAMQVYNPRLGKTEQPAWGAALKGKRVALEGYVVLPLAQQSSNDVLLTLNQWDGCCIGVPPTPYDAIEVSLVEAVDGTAEIGAFYYGRIEGTFSVDPYLAGGWLLGLYLMEDAVADFALK